MLRKYRVDYDGSVLIVHCPSLGHEFPGDLFDLMGRAGKSYPREYHGSRITQGGSTTVDLVVGSKSPDFSLYEVKESSRQDQKVLNVMPTVALEVGYYGEGERKLTLDAGRLICLSKGMIQLVATINIDHEVEKQNDGRRKLKSVVWTHWEMDPEYPKLVEENDKYELNELIPEKDGKMAEDQTTVQPPPDAYRAVVKFAQTPYWVRAYRSNIYKVLDSFLSDFNYLSFRTVALPTNRNPIYPDSASSFVSRSTGVRPGKSRIYH